MNTNLRGRDNIPTPRCSDTPLFRPSDMCLHLFHACTHLPQWPSTATTYYNPRFAMRVHLPVPASGVLNGDIQNEGQESELRGVETTGCRNIVPTPS